jgi:hypothetical protein
VTTPPGPDHYDLWMQAGGHPDLYRRLSIQAAEEDPLPGLPHQPGDDHCGVGGRPRPGHPEYRRCTCGRWYFWTGSSWAPGRPAARWLREHGLDPEEFWDMPGDSGPRLFEDFAVRRPTLLMLLRWLFRS